VSVDILLTGANGQVGWEVARRAQDLSVRALTRSDLDISDAAAVQALVAATAPRVVINATAYTAVDKAESDAATAFAVNRDGPAHLAAACARADIALVHISTDYVFDGSKTGAYVENDPVAPLGVYGASKLAGEDAVRASGVRHLILRTAWVYGVHGHNFVKTMLRLGRERDLLKVVDDQHGCPTFAGDLAEAILALSRRLIAGTVSGADHGTFHCVGQGATSWCGFARTILDRAAPHLGKHPHVEAITTADYPTPARRPANSVLDCTKLTRVHGLTLRPWQDALADMLHSTLAGAA
jgi:dTDP-4-dehydrorhamnose reductase